MAVVGMAVATLVMGACGGEKEPLGPTATVPQATTTTNPYAIPPVIDEAYVNRVLAALDHSVGETVRHTVRAKVMDEEVFYRLKAAYIGDAFQLQLEVLQDALLTDFQGYREVPGDRTTVVSRLVTVDKSCVFAEVTRDYSAYAVGQSQPSLQWVALMPLEASRNQFAYNPTPWVVSYDGFREDRSQPPNPCNAS
jgi:hypothetical protein